LPKVARITPFVSVPEKVGLGEECEMFKTTSREVQMPQWSIGSNWRPATDIPLMSTALRLWDRVKYSPRKVYETVLFPHYCSTRLSNGVNSPASEYDGISSPRYPHKDLLWLRCSTFSERILQLARFMRSKEKVSQ